MPEQPPVVKPQEIAGCIWGPGGALVPLGGAVSPERSADVAAVIVSRNRRDLVEQMCAQLQQMGERLSMDTYVIEMGTDEDQLSTACSLWYEDSDFRGKCYGHNVGLRLARARGRYRYYWILMNDLIFAEGQDAVGQLVEIADANPDIAVLSPTEHDSACQVGRPAPGRDFHYVAACDYLSLLVRAECVEQVGFLNPQFKYCWGAIHELAYRLHCRGRRVAYCDRVTMKHLGGTTYGRARGTISREDYQVKARQFAARYFREHYGSDWDEVFARALPADTEFKEHFRVTRQSWEQAPPEAPDGGRMGSVLAGLTGRLGLKKTRDPNLRKEIERLNPWYYEVEIGGIRVVPGLGSRQTAEELYGRVHYRTKLLVEEVLKRYDFSGKKLLDLASNCGYWSARYAERGAAALVAVEGRLDYVRQGRLYWDNNRFMDRESYRFVHGNVMDPPVWDLLKGLAPFDFTLCCGILYHLPDYEALLENIAAVTQGAILIDTRVSGAEDLVEEPGGWCFDAIVETRVKKNPNLNKLTGKLNALGFAVERLSVSMETPRGLEGADDYNLGNRVALLVQKRGRCE